MSEGTICPKCNYVRTSEETVPEWQCPSCQVVYAKAQPAAAGVVGDVAAPQYSADSLSHNSQLQESGGKQNLALGIAAGAGAALAGAIIWAVVSAVTNYQIGWMAVGVGALVGYAVRRAGNGTDSSFGIAGAVLSFLGCFVGNFLTIIIIVSRQESIPLLDIVSRITPEIFSELMKEAFQPMDLLFYGIAVYEGFKLSFAQSE